MAKSQHAFKGTDFLCEKCGLTAHAHRASVVRTRPQHVAEEDPCLKCGQPAAKHPTKEQVQKKREADAKRPVRGSVRGQHLSVGDPCAKCQLPASKHLSAEQVQKKKEKDSLRDDRTVDRYIVGVDGEGHDLPDGTHIYTYMAAVSENGRLVAEARNPNGLSHAECMEMMLRIPKHTLKFAFSFGYDITMMLKDLDPVDIYYIMRPQFRNFYKCDNCTHRWNSLAGRSCPICERITAKRGHSASRQANGYSHDVFNGSLTVRKGKTRSHIWDCFKFFGTSFVEAITDWDIGTPEQRKLTREMKDKRGSFQNESPEEVEFYCKLECHLLAIMMRKMIVAHEMADLTLTQFYGAGSTAAALLKKHGVREFKGPRLDEMPIALADAIKSAFVGGRFENSIVGTIEKQVEEYDIGSAYPYAQTTLPCMKCGKWRKVTGDRLLGTVKRAQLAVCRFRVKGATEKERGKIAWMPLPFRDADGSICYPTGFEGWAWKVELLPAMKGWPKYIKMLEGWVYDTKCGHEPFSYIPAVYRQRAEWGTDGAGKVLKLGMNAGYGKTAQHIGDDPPYKDMVWSGMTTATTRGQILEAIMSAKNQWNIHSVATDGIYSSVKLSLPQPNDTGTGDLKKPLGSWEHKEIPEGIFFVRPGMYFRLNAVSPKDTVKARGVGRREMYEHRGKLLRAFRTWDKKDFKYHVTVMSRRFYGAKHSILAQTTCSCGYKWPGVPDKPCAKCGKIGKLEVDYIMTPTGRRAYGLWLEREVHLNFNPLPKREAVMAGNRLRIRDVGGAVSMPYNGRTTPEGEAARLEREFMEEQPDRQDYIGPAEE